MTKQKEQIEWLDELMRRVLGVYDVPEYSDNLVDIIDYGLSLINGLQMDKEIEFLRSRI